MTTVLRTDPSFRGIEREILDCHIREARRDALSNQKDEFLLSLMRLMALPENGHSRLIPNEAISVLPLRFATIGTAVRLLDASSDFSGLIGSELININGVPVEKIEVASDKFLAGTPQRKRVIGPILFAWPSALRRLGISSDDNTFRYRIRDGVGRISELKMNSTNLVPGSMFYPQSEHGRADASWTPDTYRTIKDFGTRGLQMSLPSFFDPGETALSDAISEAAELVKSRPDIPLLIDVRGNTGGDFLRTMPLVDAISQGAEDRQVGVLVDKFTFSAAIVFVAILKHRMGTRLRLIGEEMGDGLTFFAEGGTLELSTSRALVRHSSAFHDWAGGSIDETTPEEVAEKIVPVGSLELDQIWTQNPTDATELNLFYQEVLDSLIP